MNISPFLSTSHPCDQTLQRTIRQLSQVGLRPVQTFDLHTARTELHDCSCPNHGTEQCDCQMVVLLVYGKTVEPVTLILHGNNGLTWFSIAESTRAGSDPNLPDQIKLVLQKLSISVSVGQ